MPRTIRPARPHVPYVGEAHDAGRTFVFDLLIPSGLLCATIGVVLMLTTYALPALLRVFL